ncbi:MAG: hypothetical protein IPG79_16795 [Saprospiraceae bacterium]|nr:hypothetical protein [Saprospiraceae bacterium]
MKNVEDPEVIMIKYGSLTKVKTISGKQGPTRSFFKDLKEYSPEVIFIDSLGRLGIGQIEDSRYAWEVMLF